MEKNTTPLWAGLGVVGLLAGFAGGATAAGFQLLEQNASGLGNAYAGTAAAAEDASTVYFNPAGMSALKGRDLAVSVNAIRPSAKFNNQGSSTTFPVPTILGTNNGGDAGDWALLPALYYAHGLNPDWTVGLGINAPFGLKTEYDPDWIGRFQGIKSELTTIAITPTVSYRINTTTSVGLGLRAQRADAELTTAVNPLDPTGAQQAKVEGDDWGFGFSLGILHQLTPSTRLGLAYQSQIEHKVKGNLTSPAGTTPAKAEVTLPDIVTLSFVHQLNPRWELLGDVAWTNWSKFDRLDIVNRDTGALLSSTPENWDDSWRFALGVNYRHSQAWKLRAGVAYDETPVPDAFRTVRIPDESRYWVAIGAQYRFAPGTAIDVGYAHLFVRDSSINKTEPIPGAPAFTTTVRGEYDNKVDIIGVQLSHTF